MHKPTFDPGLTQQYTGNLKRVINKDGRFNVHRTGVTWRDVHPYLFLVNLSWTAFMLIVAAGFIFANTIFATVYMLVGIEHLKGAEAPTAWGQFENAFFFSAHTLTTVGYGNIYPSGALANSVASLEALSGLLAFAIATGLMFGRFSRPSARIGFSPTMIIAPYQEATSLQFRVVNRRSNNLIDLEARLMLMTVEPVRGELQRRFTPLELEREKILFFPLTWTVVHPIDENSPLYGKTHSDLQQLQAEIMIMMKGFDDTFAQTVHSRYSYRFDEIVWGAKFTPAFDIDGNGELQVELDRVGKFEKVAPLN